ncbi:MAG: ChaN family lipoprotein [Desulforhopalus sp.]
MSFFPIFLSKATLLFMILHICLPGSGSAEAKTASNYELSISFAVEERRLIGTAKITIEPNKKLTLGFHDILITGSLLRHEDGNENELLHTQDVLILPPENRKRTLYLSYEKRVENELDNLISSSGISLTRHWYPLPEDPVYFKLTAVLPENFTAVVEADHFPLSRSGDSVTAVFSQPTTALHFNAGPYLTDSKKVREGLAVYSMFFAEDRDLANSYLEAAASYLNRYEQEIGPYPYNHYVIVANRLPTGYGMPTYTLLGQMVLRLPFIKDTSLGHEIVHSWFGNSVQVDDSEGNWCEGLTAFLADHAYRQEKGEGVDDRRESITRYLSYVNDNTAISLNDFGSASHQQPMADARRAVGYNRGALFFHELREKIGGELFSTALRTFYDEYRGRPAGWTQLQNSFEQVSGIDLTSFFQERLTRTDIPRLAAENIRIENEASGSLLSFNLIQQSAEPFSLLVPIEIHLVGESIIVKKEITGQSTPISIPVKQRPLGFTLDPDLTLLRHLGISEIPPTWSRFMGAQQKLAILASEADRSTYQPLLNAIESSDLVVTTADSVTNSDLAQNNILFLGIDQQPSRSLFGLPNHPKGRITIDVRKNPLDRNLVAVMVSASDRKQLGSVARRLKHYGKYSYLEFQDGRNIVKRITPVRSGIRYVLEELPQGGATSDLGSFEQMVNQLSESQVIYIGEGHTSLPDHLLQLRIIEKLYTRDPKLVIGMEMFPATSQQALDNYINGSNEGDERTFLKQSDYYNVWRYDYRYYRDIINFARKHRIPVIGLNLEREVVSEVFRSGTTDTLEKEVLNKLPKDRDLDMTGYTNRLSIMHGVHMQGNHGTGGESGFIQAQGIWDETMAENVANTVQDFPDHTIVVLAGTQHTRKDSGIPPRVARRVSVTQASVVNLSSGHVPANLSKLADFFFFSAPASLPEQPKIGVVLSSEKTSGASLKITKLSPHGKAEEAGLKEGDIINKINGLAVVDMTDLRLALLDTMEGDTIDVVITRQKESSKEQLVFTVELTIPPKMEGHP